MGTTYDALSSQLYDLQEARDKLDAEVNYMTGDIEQLSEDLEELDEWRSLGHIEEVQDALASANNHSEERAKLERALKFEREQNEYLAAKVRAFRLIAIVEEENQ